VYHCAAEVGFIASYEDLFAVNVGGTREMIRLAGTAGAVLHHVSSVAVFPYGRDGVVREDADTALVTTLAGGYAQSKWAAEQMIWKSITRGLRAVIYRPAQIVGVRVGGASTDLLHQVWRACAMLRAVPDMDVKMDMVTGEYAASAICALSTQPSSTGRAFHLVHPEPVLLRDFVAQFPTPLPLVPLEAWLERLQREARELDDPTLHFISMLVEGFDRADLIPSMFDCSATTAGLQGANVFCPALDRHFIERELEQMK
jgi:thioester reductase-like protein